MNKPIRHPRGERIEGYLCKDHPLLLTWQNMWRRCTEERNPHYKNYGGRGITICERWRKFKNFVEDMGPKPTTKHTIERTDNEKGYSPDNCVWESRSNQCVNRRKFKNNTSGKTGVRKIAENAFEARFDYENQRYIIGRFITETEAIEARSKFENLFFIDREAALTMIPDQTVWNNSSTKVRGVTPHKDGGYIARCTIKGERFYVGYFTTIEEAENERAKFIENKTSKP